LSSPTASKEITIKDKNSLLLGIKYEAARLSGVEGAPLARIEEQLRGEVGESWKTDEEVLKGRNATRREHDLPPLGETERRPAPETPARRPLWRRVLRR
jgi:hypothetical protein